MELDKQIEKFNFFKTTINPQTTVNYLLLLLLGPSIVVTTFFAGIFMGNEIFKELSKPLRTEMIKSFSHKEIKNFSVTSINDMLNLDKNYENQVSEAMSNYTTSSGTNQYIKMLHKDYNENIATFKNNPQSKQTISIDKYSFKGIYNSSTKGNFYEVNFKEKLINKKETTTNRTMCLNLVERNNELKINDVFIENSNKGCPIPD